MICPHCKFTIESENFCTYCGKPLDTPFVNSQKNKGSWVIAPGEIIRHISESDFANIAHLSGIIIQPGVSALIFSDGKEIAQIGSGQYDFISEQEIDNLANTRSTGWSSLRGIGINLWRAATRLLMGRKIGDTPKNFINSQHSREEIIQHLNSSSNISLYLKVDKPFPAIFGYDPFKSGSDTFVPMKVRTRLFDVEVCVSMMLQISDFRECIKYYMTGKKSLTSGDIQNAVSPYITRVIQDVLRNEDIDENGITPEISGKIAARLIETERFLFGIKITGIPEITSRNEDFDRFRTLAKELYCSEKELDYLRRTNEFKNRLAAVENEQKLTEARSDLDLKIALDEVNKDSLLHGEEMEIFIQEMAIRKDTRETDMIEALAKSTIRKMEIAASVQKRELVIASDIDNLKADLKFEEYKRDKRYESETIDIEYAIYGKRFAVKKKMMEDSFELEDMARHQDYKVRLENEDINTAILNKKLDQKRIVDQYERGKREDDYNFGQRQKEDEYAFNKRAKEDELSYIAAKQGISLGALERMNQMEQSNLDNEARRESIKRQEELRYQQYIADLERQKELDKLLAQTQQTSIYSGMSADQIAATAIAAGIANGTISDNAVGSISDMLNSKQETEAAKTLLRAREEDHIRANFEKDRLMQEQKEFMKDMAGMAFGFSKEAMQAVSAEKAMRDREREEHMAQISEMHSRRYDDAVALKEEYRTQMMHEQARTDANQDKALDYTTKVTVSDNGQKTNEKQPANPSDKKDGTIHINLKDTMPDIDQQ